MPCKKIITGSRERLLTALRCKQPDCVPVVITRNLLTNNTFAHTHGYYNLIKHARSYADIMFKQWSGTVRYLDLYPRFNPDISVDIVHGDKGTIKVTVKTPKGDILRKIRYVPGTIPEILKVTTKYFIQEREDIDRYLSIPYRPVDIGIEKVKKADEILGSRGLIQVTFWDPLGAVFDQINPETFAIWSIQEKQMLKDFVDVMSKRIRLEILRFLQAGVGEVFYFNGPEFILPPNQSPDFFDEFIIPYDTKLFNMIHDYGKLVIMHCHGKVNNFLDKFNDMGVDAMHPLEPPPKGDVNISKAKKKFGDRICLIGNIQYAELSNSTPKEIEARIKQLIGDAGAEGGLIVSPCSSLYESQLPEKTAKNYIAMIDATREFGIY